MEAIPAIPVPDDVIALTRYALEGLLIYPTGDLAGAVVGYQMMSTAITWVVAPSVDDLLSANHATAHLGGPEGDDPELVQVRERYGLQPPPG